MPRVIVSHTTSRPAPPPLGHLPLASPGRTPLSHDDLADLRTELVHGLQLSRATTMALMRLQLALRSGDRTQALEAVDRIDVLDTEIECIVARLSPPGTGDETLQAIAKHLEAQKLALAFEKLALASGVVGPDLVSIENAWPAREEPAPVAATDEEDAVREMPDLSELWSVMDEFEAENPRSLPVKFWGLIASLFVVMAAAGAFLLLR